MNHIEIQLCAKFRKMLRGSQVVQPDGRMDGQTEECNQMNESGCSA